MATLTNPVLLRIARVLQLTQTVALVLVIGVAGALLVNARSYDEANDWVEHTHDVLDHLNQVRTTTLRGGLALRNYALVPQPVSVERLRSASQDARLAAQRLEALVQDNHEQSGRAAEVRSETLEITGWYLASAVIAERDGADALRNGLHERITNDGSRRLRQVLDDMEREERQLLQQRQNTENRELVALKRWSIGLAGAFIAFMIWTIVYSTRLVRIGDRDMSTLAHSADTDPLTGLFNRRALERKAQALEGQVMSVAVFDLDDFKPVNDRYGHAAGDQVLRTIGQRLREQCRDADVLARVGGDEFVIVFPGLDNEVRLRQIQRRLDDALSAPIDIDGGRVAVGVSIGCAMSHGEQSFEQLLEIADDRSYEEKKRRKAGRVTPAPSRIPG